MKTREESNKNAREARVQEIMDRIRSAVALGNFEIDADLDEVQSEILNELGYELDILGKSKRHECGRYKISW